MRPHSTFFLRPLRLWEYPDHVSFNGIGPGGPYREQKNVKESLKKIYPFGYLEVYYPITPVLFNEFFNGLVNVRGAGGQQAEKEGMPCHVLPEVFDLKDLERGRIVKTFQVCLLPGIKIHVGAGAKA